MSHATSQAVSPKSMASSLLNSPGHALLYHPDESLLHESLPFIKDGLDAGSEFIGFYASQIPFEAFLQEANSLSLFHSQKVILLFEAEKFYAKIKTYASSLFQPSANRIYLLSSQFNASQIKTLKGSLEVFAYEKEKPWEKEKRRQQAVLNKLKDLEVHLKTPERNYFISFITQLEEGVDKEWQKLVSLGEKEPSLSTLKSLFPIEKQQDFWALVEALYEGKFTLFYQYIQEELKSQDSPFALLSQLRSQFQQGLLLCCVMEGSYKLSDFQKHYPYLKGRLLEKKQRQVARLGKKGFQEFLSELFSIEVKLKSDSKDFIKDFLTHLLQAIAKLKNPLASGALL